MGLKSDEMVSSQRLERIPKRLLNQAVNLRLKIGQGQNSVQMREAFYMSRISYVTFLIQSVMYISSTVDW